MTNRLAHETSPYLLQHANNPVDWYPWGPEALERARSENRPILLSIGYAACHWCHVMAHESFENAAIAALMNEHFVNIKVDREERPDLDSIYMQAVQAMTGHGGWPMTVFLTPAGEPFYGGTYFPPTDRQGTPGFPRVLAALADAYQHDRASVERTGTQLRDMYTSTSAAFAAEGAASAATLDRAARALSQQFDERHAGFGRAPKFPPSMGLEFLLTHAARTGATRSLDMAHRTFLAMAAGGIYDQVGGGLHRYSVDERWLVPHFEKMLYDNALFVRLGAHLWQATHDATVRRVTEETVRWLEREMTSPEGGFYSSLDADSEGHEGKFYVWDERELDDVLGADAALAKAAWGVTAEGNFEGRNLLFVPNALGAVASRAGVETAAVESALDRARQRLYPVRASRVRPACDDKVLASWNGLMLRGLTEVARVFGDRRARTLALNNGAFLRDALVSEGRVFRSWRAGKVQPVGFLEDYAAVGLGFLDLFSLTSDVQWLSLGRQLCERAIHAFRDPVSGLFFDTPNDHEALITRPRDVSDNALPAGTSLIAELLMRLSVFDDRTDYAELGERIVKSLADAMGRYPAGFGHLLGVADLVVHGAVEVAIVGEAEAPSMLPLEESVAQTWVPSLVYASTSVTGAAATALTRGKGTAGQPLGFVCRRYLCHAPAADPESLRAALVAAARAG